MVSERIQRQIDRLLDEAEQSLVQRDWDGVSRCAADVLALDPENADAQTFLVAAERATGSPASPANPAYGRPHPGRTGGAAGAVVLETGDSVPPVVTYAGGAGG